MKPGIACTLTCVGVLLFAGNAIAADIAPVTPEVQPVATEDGWTFKFAPYFWAASLSGDAGNFGLPTVHVDASFGDIFDHLDFAAMAAGEARYGPYSIFTDIIYSKISGTGATPRGALATSASLDSKTFAGLLGVGYSLLEDDAGQLDIVAGARVWSVENTISLTGGALGGQSKSDSATWVDALGGFRGNYSITPTVYLTGWGLVGGGGADIDWDVAAAIGYKFNDSISATLGYRALGVDYSKNGFVLDVVQRGPIMNLVVNF